MDNNSNYTNFIIEELLNKYFEGETSSEEERKLRHYFSSNDVPTEWEGYKSLFAYFDEEIEMNKQKKPLQPVIKPLSHNRRILILFSGVAACLLLLFSINLWINPPAKRFCADNYVIINGRCYTDMHTIRAMAFEAFHEVATPADEYFPKTEDSNTDLLLIENQLKELSTFFSND
ncbi:hypothetical protein LJC43_05445 [Parabacteroides sp. OttesenSCG-928-G21]|nr:hypothetical protein [Parabacteroides sp. OttesenSCG-928-G21]